MLFNETKAWLFDEKYDHIPLRDSEDSEAQIIEIPISNPLPFNATYTMDWNIRDGIAMLAKYVVIVVAYKDGTLSKEFPPETFYWKIGPEPDYLLLDV